MPVSDEKITIGLFLNADNKPLFDYSETKLRIAAKLTDSGSIDSVEKILRNIKRKISASTRPDQIEAFEIGPFTESYFKYLSNYSNNILHYSDPTENRGIFRPEEFTGLFRLLVDREYGVTKVDRSFKDVVKKRISSSIVKEKIDVFYRIPKETIKTVYADHEVDYIGVNGSIFSGNSIDFSRDPYNLEHKLYLLKFVALGLINLSEKLNLNDSGGNKHIVYYNDPEGSKNKGLLHDAKTEEGSPLIFKHWDEFNDDENWIVNTPTHKFSELVEKELS